MLAVASISAASWSLICIIVAIILFALAAFNVASSKVSLGWLGMLFLALAMALGGS